MASALDDWDPMEDDFKDNFHAGQTPEDGENARVELDHYRLFVRHVPKTLDTTGFKKLFSDYGTVVNAFINPHPYKRYGMVTFETTSQAQNAMMQINITRPMTMIASIAKKNPDLDPEKKFVRQKQASNESQNTNQEQNSKNNQIRNRAYKNQPRQNGPTFSKRNTPQRGQNMQDTSEQPQNSIHHSFSGGNISSSTSSSTLKQIALTTGSIDYMEDLANDPDCDDLDLELEELKMREEQLNLRAKQLKIQKAKRAIMLEQAAAASRRVTPSGMVTVRSDSRGGGDAEEPRVLKRKIPRAEHLSAVYDTPYSEHALHRAIEALKLDGEDPPPPLTGKPRGCVNCSRPTEVFCGRCGVTPYCSASCQRRDWKARHASVCHNLASHTISAESDSTMIEGMPALKGFQDKQMAITNAADSTSAFDIEPMKPLRTPRNNQNRSSYEEYEKPVRPGFRKLEDRLKPNDNEKQFTQDAVTRHGPARDGSRMDSPNANRNDFNYTRNNDDSGRMKNDFEHNQNDIKRSNFKTIDNAKLGNDSNYDSERPIGNRNDFSGPGANRNNAGPLGNRNVRPGGNNNDFPRPGMNRNDGRPASNRNSFQRTGFKNDAQGNQENKAKADNEDNVHIMPAGRPTKPEDMKAKLPIAGRRPPLAHENKENVYNRNLPEQHVPVQKPKEETKKIEVTKLAQTPTHYVVELLEIGDDIVLDVQAEDGNRRLCLSFNETFWPTYQALLEDFAAVCASNETAYAPKPGDLIAYLDSEEEWYRGRFLLDDQIALIDACRLVQAPILGNVRTLPAKFAVIPEFTCVLNLEAPIGSKLKCTVKSKGPNGAVKVNIEDMSGGSVSGEGLITRWQTNVQVPVATPTAKVAAPAAKVASPAANVAAPTAKSDSSSSAKSGVALEVERPALVHGLEVLLVDAATSDRVFVRPADRKSQLSFALTEQDVAEYGLTAEPLRSPPAQGQLVVAKFSDNVHYRAQVARTNVKNDKYLLEYLEYGNTEVTNLSALYPCPEVLDIAHRPVLASRAVLAGVGSSAPLPPELREIKDTFLLQLTNGAKSAPSGGEVKLTYLDGKNKGKAFNSIVDAMTKPDWKKMEEKGLDVLQSEILTLDDVTYVKLPLKGGQLRVLDATFIQNGYLSVCSIDEPLLQFVLEELTNKMAAYCESDLGKDPYLPRVNELCIARFLPFEQWFRALVIEQTPGSPEMQVLYLDFGNTGAVNARDVRKMLPEFIHGHPVLACNVIVEGFPSEDLTEQQAEYARKHIGVTKENPSEGILTVTSCSEVPKGELNYVLTAPALLAAIHQ